MGSTPSWRDPELVTALLYLSLMTQSYSEIPLAFDILSVNPFCLDPRTPGILPSMSIVGIEAADS